MSDKKKDNLTAQQKERIKLSEEQLIKATKEIEEEQKKCRQQIDVDEANNEIQGGMEETLQMTYVTDTEVDSEVVIGVLQETPNAFTILFENLMSLDQKMKDMHKKMEDMRQEIKGMMDQKMEDMRQEMKGIMNQKIEDMRQEIEAMMDKKKDIEAMDQKMKHLDKKIKNICQEMESKMDKKMEHVGHKMDNMDKNIEKIKSSVPPITAAAVPESNPTGASPYSIVTPSKSQSDTNVEPYFDRLIDKTGDMKSMGQNMEDMHQKIMDQKMKDMRQEIEAIMDKKMKDIHQEAEAVMNQKMDIEAMDKKMELAGQKIDMIENFKKK